MTLHIQSPRVTALRAGLLCCLILAPGLPPVRAADGNPPERMTYQGYLVDANGAALGDPAPRNYDVVFRIWQHESSTSGGDLLWTEQQTVTVDKGYFSVLLGEGSQVGSEARPALSTVFRGTTASERWLGLTVKGIGSGGADSDILPRLRLLASPYAFLAAHAVQAGRLVNSSSQQVVTVADSRVGINQTSPTEALEVNGSMLATDKVTAAGVYGDTVYFARDGSYYAKVKDLHGGMNPVIGFDGYDWLAYKRAENEYDFRINSAAKLLINNSGVTVPSPNTISGYGTIPMGGIIMWSGSTVPDGWTLCNGQNGTPDLRNRFVVGSGSSYATGNTGGESSHTLSVAEIPSHNHRYIPTDDIVLFGDNDGDLMDHDDSGGVVHKDPRYTRSFTESTGGGAAHENRPPYYALAFIMRVK